jgi:hypothetical protein
MCVTPVSSVLGADKRRVKSSCGTGTDTGTDLFNLHT